MLALVTRRRIPLVLVVVLLLALTISISITFAADTAEELVRQQMPFSPTVMDWEKLALGDVVAEGVRNMDGTCQIDSFQMRTETPKDGSTRWLGIRIDTENCRAVVNALWEGALEEGPNDVIEPLLNLLPSSGVPHAEQPQQGPVGDNGVSMVNCKTSQIRVFMYGYGGTGDRLTYKHGTLEFCYDGTNATIRTQSGACAGSKPFSWYEWVVDGCFTTSVNGGPASVVSRSGRGDYHCDPATTFPCNSSAPDGYYHSLYDSEIGRADGSSQCVGYSSGDIVAGVDTEILQGCS